MSSSVFENRGGFVSSRMLEKNKGNVGPTSYILRREQYPLIRLPPKAVNRALSSSQYIHSELRTVIPSGQSDPWSGLQVGSPASPVMIMKSLGQSGLKYLRPPKPGGTQATARSRG
ncbi:hypothetical protein L873DRAFT_1272476 [Choiromyces venosus 120613-1]|uniref:Uncharacterized protein n=1 Tax=Choiromyces venosus 120613-1 TaxID=1336337 RepID=A0A3N4K1V0_9PEZI|nr:hypothetical protein L873DRAFT_1272476 [Choiromyces venosus 120613-1]